MVYLLEYHFSQCHSDTCVTIVHAKNIMSNISSPYGILVADNEGKSVVEA